MPFVARETWTHDFFLLSSPTSSTSPTFHDLGMLIAAGLGKKRVVFDDKHGGFDHIKTVLEKEYPKLKSQNGAFEFLRAERGGASRPLFPIPFSANGYSLPYLRDCIGSGMVYIRPLQSVLSTDPLQEASNSGVQSVTTMCVNCSQKVPINGIRQHIGLCNGGSSTSTDDNDDVTVIEAVDEKPIGSQGKNIQQHITIYNL